MLTVPKRPAPKTEPATSEPIRTCVGCRRTCGCGELARVSLGASGELLLNASRGRGAWLCRATKATCGAKAARSGGFARAFKRRVDPAQVEAFVERLVGNPNVVQERPPAKL